MENYLLYFIKFNLYLTVLTLSYQLFFKKYKNFNFSRPYLLFGIISAFFLPLLSFQSLNQFGDQVLIGNILQEVVVSSNSSDYGSGFNRINILINVYTIGLSFFFLRFILKVRSLLSLKSITEKQTTHYSIPNSSAAFSFMNWIFIGDQLSNEDREIVLLHERVHVDKKHSLDLLFCQVLEILFWINPIVFRLKHQFDEVHEYEADELSCHREEDYVRLLLKQSFNHYSFIPIHQFNSTHLKQRIMRIKKQSSRKINPKSVAVSILAFGMLFFINQNLNSTESYPTTLDNISPIGGEDKRAQFPGGNQAMYDFIIKNTKYPKHLIEERIEGKVYIEFNIGKDGSISDAKILGEAHPELKKLGIETIKKMPDWEPAEKNGIKIASKMTLPISFLPPPPPPPAPPVTPSTPPSTPSPKT